MADQHDQVERYDKQVHELLKSRFTTALVFATTIGRSVRYREAGMMRLTIFEHPQGQEQAAQFTAAIRRALGVVPSRYFDGLRVNRRGALLRRAPP